MGVTPEALVEGGKMRTPGRTGRRSLLSNLIVNI